MPSICCSLCRKIFQIFLSFDQTTNQQAKSTIRTFLLYMFYMSNVIVLALLTESPNEFLISKTFQHHLFEKEFSIQSNATPAKFVSIDFHRISTLNDIWTYLRSVIGPIFYPIDSSPMFNRTVDQVNWILDHFLLMGVVRLRQVRVKSEPCPIPKSYSDEIQRCFPTYSPTSKSTENFGPMIDNNQIDVTVRDAWKYSSAQRTQMESWSGDYGYYDADGYLIDLGKHERFNRRLLDDIDQLERFSWLDKATRAVFVDALTYNPSVNLFSYVKIVFEMPSTGGIFPSYRIEHRQFLRNRNKIEYLRYVCEFILIIFTILFVIMEMILFVKYRLKIFVNLWNWIDFLHIFTSIGMFISELETILLVKNRSATDFSLTRPTFDFFTVRLFRLQGRLNRFHVMLTSISIIRLLKYCDFSANLVRIKATIKRCFGDLIGFLIMFVAIIIAYAQFGNLTLGQRAPDFSTMGKALVALFRTVLSDFDYDAIHDASPIIGPLFFFLYIFSMVFLLFNMVLAIIVDSYEELGSEHRNVLHRMLIDVSPLIKSAIRVTLQRLHLWNKVKVLLQFILGTDDSSDTKTIEELLQTFKYSGAPTAMYEDLRKTFLHDLKRTITKHEFELFLKFAHEDQIRQRETLRSLFVDHLSVNNLIEQQEWNNRMRNLCTIQQWAQLRYRVARLTELCQLIEAKVIHSIETSKWLFDQRTRTTESLKNK